MSDIGGVGSTNDPFLQQVTGRAQGEDIVDQQRQAQDAISSRAKEALFESGDGRTVGERERDTIRESAGPGIRREEVARQGDSPRLRRLADETRELDDSTIGRAREEAERTQGTERQAGDEVRLSREAQQRLASEQQAPAPGETVTPQRDDPLSVDTAQERQQADFADQVNRGNNETEAARPLGQLLDQFS